jgi:hypothetical protein
MPPTKVHAKVTPAVATKIYANHYKGYVPFKPWKGMGGCAWFAFAGNPFSGNLADQGKTIDVIATIDIPAATLADSLKEVDLLEMFTKLGGDETKSNSVYPKNKEAEKKMWLAVAKRAQDAADGLLVVDVGKTRFSKAEGQFVLVNNQGMQKVEVSDQQAQAIIGQLDGFEQVVEAIQTKFASKNTEANQKIVLSVRLGDKARKNKNIWQNKLENALWRHITTANTEKGSTFKKPVLTTTIEAPTYAVAKQLMRVLVPYIVQLKQEGEVFQNLMVTLWGVEYKTISQLSGPNRPWDYKASGTGEPPSGSGLMRIGAPATTEPPDGFAS